MESLPNPAPSESHSDQPSIHVERILAAVDLTAESEHVLEWAELIAKRFHASLDLIYVWDGSEVEAEPADGLGPAVETRIDVERDLDQLTHLPGKAAPDARTVVRSGRPWHEIIGECERGQYDALVMGTHGRKGLSHLLAGSVAEQVLRNARIPVFVIPSHRRTQG